MLLGLYRACSGRLQSYSEARSATIPSLFPRFAPGKARLFQHSEAHGSVPFRHEAAKFRIDEEVQVDILCHIQVL